MLPTWYGRIWNEAELNEETGGRGAHVSGITMFNTITNLYLYIGGKGTDGIVNVQKLTGQTLDRGNGTDGRIHHRRIRLSL